MRLPSSASSRFRETTERLTAGALPPDCSRDTIITLPTSNDAGKRLRIC
jgi:hypothetical protein